MRTTPMACALAAGWAPAGAAHARDVELRDERCSHSTDDTVQLMPEGVAFHRDNGMPAQVLMR